MIEELGLAILIFVAAAAYDWANANYVRANTEDRAAETANWSAVVALFGLVGLLGIVTVSKWLAIPEILGFWAGTYLAVSRRKARRE